MINREEICSACLEYQSQVIQISDDYVKQVYKSFTNDYQNDGRLYLCYYCKYTFTKISKFIKMCVQSYSFFAKNLHCSKFNSDIVAKEKSLVENRISLNTSNIIHLSLPFNKFTDSNNHIIAVNHSDIVFEETPFINIKLKQENVDEDSDDPLATYFDNDDVKYPVNFKQEIMQSTSDINSIKSGKTKTQNDTFTIRLNHDKSRETNDFKFDIKVENFNEDSEDSHSGYSDDNDDVELPIEFENQVNKTSKKSHSKASKSKTSKKSKGETKDTINMDENVTHIKLSREDQIKELEEKRLSEKYLQAVYKCEKCTQTFEYEISLNKHNTMKHDESRGPYECWLCHIRFSKSEHLKTHCLHHSTKLLCKLCNFESHIRKTMRYHLECHAGVTHSCHLCYKVFKYRNTLSNHLETHKVDKTNKQFKCQQCDKAFYSKNILQKHEYNMHTDIKPYSCETCGKSFKTKTNLNIHLTSHAEKTGEFYCVECDVSFKTQNILKCHLDNAIKHRDPSLLKFECKQCPMKFKSQKKLDSHIQTSHERIPKFPCNICGVLFVTRHILRSHKYKVHQRFDKYECPTCEKHFFCKQVLDNHIRTHTGERPFECTLCDWKFAQKAALRTHIKLKHQNNI